jgi:hypothetical protein
MTRAVSLVCLAIVGVLVLVAATPTISRLASALTPLILVIGTLVLAWRIVCYFTRP